MPNFLDYNDYRRYIASPFTKIDIGKNTTARLILNTKESPIPTPKKIIRSGPVTVILWDDKTKTLVRRADGAEDDPYLAFCAGLAKKIYGNNSKVKKLIEEKTVETKERKQK